MILYHPEPDSPVIEISVEGKITDHDLREAIERMRGDLDLNGKTGVLERIEHFAGIEPKALWSDITLGVSVARKVTRAAVVADAGWIRASMHLARFFSSLRRPKSRRSTSTSWSRRASGSTPERRLANLEAVRLRVGGRLTCAIKIPLASALSLVLAAMGALAPVRFF